MLRTIMLTGGVRLKINDLIIDIELYGSYCQWFDSQMTQDRVESKYVVRQFLVKKNNIYFSMVKLKEVDTYYENDYSYSSKVIKYEDSLLGAELLYIRLSLPVFLSCFLYPSIWSHCAVTTDIQK